MTPAVFAAVVLFLSHADSSIVASPAERVEVRGGTGFLLEHEAKSVSVPSGGLVPEALLTPVAEAPAPLVSTRAEALAARPQAILGAAKPIGDARSQSAAVDTTSRRSEASSSAAAKTALAVSASAPAILEPAEGPSFTLKDIAGAAQGLAADEALEILAGGGGAETVEARAIRAIGVHTTSAQ